MYGRLTPSFYSHPKLNRREYCLSLAVAKELAHLAASLLHVNPTAIGRIPPAFFSNASRFPHLIALLSLQSPSLVEAAELEMGR